MKATHAGHVRTGATCAVLYTSKLLTTGFEHVATTSSTHSQILSDRQKSLHCNVCDHCRQPATGRSLFYCQSFSDLTISKDNFRLNISLRMHTVLTHRSTTEAISSSEWTQQKEREEQFGGDNTTRSRFTAQSWWEATNTQQNIGMCSRFYQLRFRPDRHSTEPSSPYSSICYNTRRCIAAALTALLI